MSPGESALAVLLLTLAASAAAAEHLLKNVYRDSESYERRYLLDSPYYLCREQLVAKGRCIPPEVTPRV